MTTMDTKPLPATITVKKAAAIAGVDPKTFRKNFINTGLVEVLEHGRPRVLVASLLRALKR
jgi:hypothetical protein